MDLIVGGFAQGKWEYVVSQYGLREDATVQGAVFPADAAEEQYREEPCREGQCEEEWCRTEQCGEEPCREEQCGKQSQLTGWRDLHLWIRQQLELKKECLGEPSLDAELLERELWKSLQKWICSSSFLAVTCDELGSGIVPMDRLERVYREVTGRICCRLAKQAGRVIRIVCGYPVVIQSREPAESGEAGG